MEEQGLPDVYHYDTDLPQGTDYQYESYPSTDTAPGYVVEIFNVICALCLGLTIAVRKELHGNPNNWSAFYFAVLTCLISLCAVVFGYSTDIEMAKAIPPTICVILRIVIYSPYMAFHTAQLFLMIDRVDWLSDSKRHNTRMTTRAYGITIGVLLVVSFVSSVAFFARPVEAGFEQHTCVSSTSLEFMPSIQILGLVQAVAFLAISIAAPIIYKKRQPSGDKDDDAKEAKETLIITCLLSVISFISYFIKLVFYGARGIHLPLYYVFTAYYGFACLLMLGVFSKFRHGFLCRRAATRGETDSLL